jgi:DNA-nicking Smr family endonuclease
MAKDKKRRAGRTLGKEPGNPGKPGKRGKPADLTDDERALWEFAARDLKPLKSAKGRVHVSQEPGAANDAARIGNTVEPAQARPPPRVAAPPAKTPPQKATPPPPLTTELGRRQARRIEVEARIDLHGMRQAQAHTALRRFLLSSHAAGRRWVLVITGKGSARREAREGDDAGFYAREEPGVLRRNVPRWLAEPDLRAIVVGYSSAAIRHGGEGALYVQLRRRERTGRA